ncbi:MAG: Hpt domain-containing protein, partial [Pyrinomonadaceae bacterium]
MDDEPLSDLLSDAEALVERISDDLKTLRERGAVGGRFQREAVARVFRHVHTLKGSAAVATELESVSEIADAFETLLDAVRGGRLNLDEATLDLLDTALDSIATHLNDAARGAQTIPSNELVSRLREVTSHSASQFPGSDDVIKYLPQDLAHALNEPERVRLHAALAEGARLFVIEANFGLTSFDDQLRALHGALETDGEVISTLPYVNAATPERVNFKIVYAAQRSDEEVAACLAPFGATVLKESRERETSESPPVQSGDGAASSTAAPHASTHAQTAVRVRVSQDELDALVSLTRELSADVAAALRSAQGGANEVGARIETRFRELEKRLDEMRLTPLGQTLERAVRA